MTQTHPGKMVLELRLPGSDFHARPDGDLRDDEHERVACGVTSFQTFVTEAAEVWRKLTNRGEGLNASFGLAPDAVALRRIAAWEGLGLGVHVRDGLPSRATAESFIFSEIAEFRFGPETYPAKGYYFERVLGLHARLTARSPIPDACGDVVMTGALDDKVIERMAEFLWNHRHGDRAQHHGETP